MEYILGLRKLPVLLNSLRMKNLISSKSLPVIEGMNKAITRKFSEVACGGTDFGDAMLAEIPCISNLPMYECKAELTQT
jgi:hypothetical protein